MGTELALSRERMGRIRVPSGQLLIVDPGYLRFWSHASRPVPYVSDAGESREQADFEIVGEDAERAGKEFGRQWNPRFLFDMPCDYHAELGETFAAFAAAKNLKASLRARPEPVPHRTRAELALKAGNGAGEVQFQGLWSVAIDHLPSRETLEVYGERFSEGPDQGRWRRVVIECSAKAVVRSEKAGMVMVDYARLLLADLDALPGWSDESRDGLADVAFWGADADRVNDTVQAEWLPEGVHGWADLSLAQAEARYEKVQALKTAQSLALQVDFRPHSHQFLLLKQIRANATESGEVTVGDAQFCGFSTTWGDGLFAAYRDFAEDGSLARVRLDLGSDEMVQRQRTFDEWWTGAFAKYVCVSNRVWKEGQAARWMYRSPSGREQDSGWCVFAGDEDQDYNDNPENMSIVRLRDLIALDKSLENVFRAEAPCAFERASAGAAFASVEYEEPPE